MGFSGAEIRKRQQQAGRPAKHQEGEESLSTLHTPEQLKTKNKGAIMVAQLVIWGILSLLFAISMLGVAKSAVHEIEAGIAFLIATLSFGQVGIIRAIKGNGESTQTPKRHLHYQCPHCGETLYNKTSKCPLCFKSTSRKELEEAIRQAEA